MGAGWFGWAMPRRAYLRRQHATAKGNDPAVFGPVTKGHALECASARLRAERKVFMKAVKDYVEAELKDASAELRADRRAVLAAVRHATMSSSPLRYASDELRADRKVVMAAVKRRGHALEYASAGLRADRKVVMAAVQRRGSSLIAPFSRSAGRPARESSAASLRASHRAAVRRTVATTAILPVRA